MNSIAHPELTLICQRILEKLAFVADEQGKIQVETSLYRQISSEDMSRFEKPHDWHTNNAIEIGDLSDDIAELKKLADPNRPCTFVDMDRLASLLRVISQEMNPPV